LKKRVAIVAGASRSHGIGQAAVVALAKKGIRLVIADRIPLGDDRAILDLERLVAEARAEGAEAIGMNVDSRDEQQLDECVSGVLERYGRIDVLVNNAVAPESGENFLSTGIDQWQQVLTTGVISTINFCRRTIPVMVQQNGGSVINIVAPVVTGGVQDYFGSATRQAVMGVSRALASEFSPQNVLVNVVCPGLIYPGIAEEAAVTTGGGVSQQGEAARQWREYLKAQAGEPVGVGAAVAFLVSDFACALSGMELPVTCATSLGDS